MSTFRQQGPGLHQCFPESQKWTPKPHLWRGKSAPFLVKTQDFFLGGHLTTPFWKKKQTFPNLVPSFAENHCLWIKDQRNIKFFAFCSGKEKTHYFVDLAVHTEQVKSFSGHASVSLA